MKPDARRLPGFLADPGTCRVVLLYGDNVGLIRARSEQLIRTIVGALDDPFRAATLDRDGHSRIAEEAAAQSLTGGRRAVRVRDVTDSLQNTVKSLLDGKSDTLLVLEGPDLPARSKLRTLLEASPNGAAIGCYPEEGRSLETSIRAALSEHGVTARPEALALLQSLLGADAAQTRAETAKAALYAGQGGELSVEDVEACIGDGAALSLEEALFAATSGDLALADRALSVAMAEGVNPVSVVRQAMMHMQRLHRARLAMANGASAGEATSGVRPPVFFKRAPAFNRALDLWPLAAIEEALEALFRAESACKRTGAPDVAIAEGAVLRIAVRSARRRK
jgi:DNA polymerase III subunit delta